MTYVVHFGILGVYAKNQGKILMFNGASCHLKFHLPPSEAKIFFVSKYGNIYIKSCVLKNVSQEKQVQLS